MIRSPALRASITVGVMGFLLSVGAFYPGYLSQDSVSQLYQARHGVSSDWQPPIMSALWRLSDRVIPGAGGMLLLQNLIFWSGLALIAYVCVAQRKRVWLGTAAFLVMGTLPPVLGELSTIWKDVGLGVALTAACGFMLLAALKPAPWKLTAALPFLFYATAVRLNAPPAVWPLGTWWVSLAMGLDAFSARRRWVWATALGSGLTIALVTAASFTNRALNTGERTFPLQQILLHDLTAVAVATGEVRLPDYPHAPEGTFSLEDLRADYSPREIVPLFTGDGHSRHFLISAREADHRALTAKWLEVMPSHPAAYLAHRLRVFKNQMGMNDAPVCLAYWEGSVPGSRLNSRVMSYLREFRDGLGFRGWFWLALNALLVCAAIRRLRVERGSDRRFALALLFISGSGALYAWPYFFVSTTCDFRLHWWLTLATLFAGLILVSDPQGPYLGPRHGRR